MKTVRVVLQKTATVNKSRCYLISSEKNLILFTFYKELTFNDIDSSNVNGHSFFRNLLKLFSSILKTHSETH